MGIMVGAYLESAQRAKTMLHEPVHALLHSDEISAEYIEHRGVKQTEAESVAYIMAPMLAGHCRLQHSGTSLPTPTRS